MIAGPDAPSEQELGVLKLYFGSGDLATAERLAMAMTRDFPDHAFAWKILATIAMRAGRPADASAALLQACRSEPGDAGTHGNLGVVLQQLGRLNEAEASYRQAVRLDPGNAGVHCNLGNALFASGRLAEAETSYREAIRLDPSHAAAHCNLGNTLKDLGRTGEAERAYRAALRADPDLAAAHYNLAAVLKDLARPREAEASYREALRRAPDWAEAHYNLANTLKDLGRPDEAELGYREAISRKPGHVEAHNNLGNILRDLGRLDEAEARYRFAIRHKPGYAEAHGNLGTALYHLGRVREAEASFRDAIRLDPALAEAHSNLGVTLYDLGNTRDAEASYREAIRLKPDSAELRSNLLFCLNCAESFPAESALAEAKRYGDWVSSRAVPKFTAWRASPRDAKLRIGFVSGDLRNHPVGYFVEGLAAHLDPAAFEIFAFQTSPKSDDLTARLKPRFRDWISICGQSDRAAAKAIHDRAIHVLIDLAGHTADNRLPVFSRKPAPVQASWLGYFATTGLPEIDYFIGDPYVSPADEARHFSERLWNLPDTWLCLTPPDRIVPIAGLPALTKGHVTFGCFGNLAKMNDGVVGIWARILARVPGAKLFLKSKQLADAGVAGDTRGRFQARGIPGDRLILEAPSPRAVYLDAYNRVDLVLDTFPYPGGTTSSEAMWMGVPVLTLAGGRFLARVGQSIARNVGQDDWIATDPDAYVGKAVAFARDLPGLAAIRATLRERALRSPLFDAERFAGNFGAAMSRMYSAHAESARLD